MSEEIEVVVTQPLTRTQQVEQSLVTELEKAKQEAEPVKSEETEAAPIEEDESETITEESAPEEEDVEQEEQPKKSKGGFQKRIDKLTKKASELERQLEAERAEKAQLLATKPPEAPKAPTNDDTAPNPDDFETYADYNKALIRHEAKLIRDEERRQEAQQRIDAELASAGKKFQEKLKEVASLHDDFDEVFDPDLTVNGAMQAVMLESEVGAELAYYLCKNPDEAAEIASMNPIQSARKMALIEAKLSKLSEETPEQRKRISKAPAPVNPTGGTSAGGSKDPNKMSPEEFGVWFKKTYGRR